MSAQVVVLGTGYAGTGAIQSLEDHLDGSADVTWVSETDYHLVLHESHRCISDPEVQENVTIPVERIKSPRTEFLQAHVVGIDTEDQRVELADRQDLEYDYLLVGLGSQTAYFGIDGLQTHAHTLKSLEDALDIHDSLKGAAGEASRTDPARVVIGGAGLSGIQTAGEVAEFRDEFDAHIEISLVEGLEEIFPGNDPSIQRALRTRLESRGVDVITGQFIGSVSENRVHFGDADGLEYDVLVWTGGITGQDALRDANVGKDDRNHRLETEGTFRTDDERVFALGDAALIDQPGENPAPPTAQAAWQAAEVAGENIARAIRGQPLKRWTYNNKGTVVSVGEDAVAHNVSIVPLLSTFGGPAARLLKKAIAVRWIASITDLRRAIAAWPDM